MRARHSLQRECQINRLNYWSDTILTLAFCVFFAAAVGWMLLMEDK